MNSLQRMVFRASRGNAFMRFAELEYENTNAILNERADPKVKKSVFLIIFQIGTTSDILKQRVVKLLESKGAIIVNTPNDIKKLDELIV